MQHGPFGARPYCTAAGAGVLCEARAGFVTSCARDAPRVRAATGAAGGDFGAGRCALPAFEMGRIGKDGEYEFFEEACSEGVTNEHRLAAGRQAAANGERRLHTHEEP